MPLSGTAPGWEPPDDPDTGSECSHPEVSPSPRFVAAKTQTNQSGKKASASVVRCSTLLHRTPPATQTQPFRAPNSGSPANKATSGTDSLCHPTRPPFPLPPPATAVPGAIVPLQEQEWGSPRSGGRIGVLALPLTGPETLLGHLTNLSEPTSSYPESEGCTREFANFSPFKQEAISRPRHGLTVFLKTV